MIKGIKSVAMNKKKNLYGEEIIKPPKKAKEKKVNVLEAGYTTIENMIFEVQEEGRKNQSRKQDPTLTSIFEILDEHNKRLVHCEEVNNSLLQQFSDLSQLVNDSLLSSFSHSSKIDVSRISVEHDELSQSGKTDVSTQSQHSLVIPPLFSNSQLPPYTHTPVESGDVTKWTSDMLEELITSVSTSLQCWLREKEQLLLLKRLLIHVKCIENEEVDEWYNQEIALLEDYYKQENNQIEHELQDIRFLLQSHNHSENSSKFTKPLSSQKKESELQIRSTPSLAIKTSTSGGDFIILQANSSTKSNSTNPSFDSSSPHAIPLNKRIIEIIEANLDIIINSLQGIGIQYDILQLSIESILKEHEIEKNNQLLQIMATALSNMIQTILTSNNGIQFNEMMEIKNEDFSTLKELLYQSLETMKQAFDSSLLNSTINPTIPINRAREQMKQRMKEYLHEIYRQQDVFIHEISKDIVDEMIVSHIY